MCCAVLSSSVTEFEVHLCIDLVERWQQHVLMAYHLLVSAVVLLEDLDRHISWREFSQNDVVLGKALHAWCQSRYLTYVSVHPIATWEALYISSFCHRLSTEMWLPRLLLPLLHGPCATGYISAFFPRDRVTAVLSTEFSRLQMFLWFGPSYLDWVEARRHIDTCSPSGTCFRQETHWIVAEACLSWINSTLPIS